jgi:hypothetical protein
MSFKKIILSSICIVCLSIVIVLTFYNPEKIDNKESSTTSHMTSNVTTTETTILEETSEKLTTTTKESETIKKVETTKPTIKPQTTKEQAIEADTGCSIPSNGGRFKSYTNYRLLSKNSPQWNKIQCHENAYTDVNGLRKVGDYYCVAMGSYYSSTLGDTFEITTEGGTFQAVLCDFKANQHTDSTNRYTAHNGCVIEFYVDMDSLNSTARQMGDISYADSKFSGKILSITKTGNIF